MYPRSLSHTRACASRHIRSGAHPRTALQNLAHIQAEQPWGKVGSGAPKLAIDGGRRALPTEVAKGTVFNEGGEDSFVGLNMGKNGSGAPLRQKDGSINARHKQIMSTFSHHLEGPDDAWAARHMGKEAPGAGPKVSEDGQILARKNCVVSKHRIHAEASEPTYHDQIFGKPAMGVRPNDQGRLGRTFDVTQHRIHKVILAQLLLACQALPACCPVTSRFPRLGDPPCGRFRSPCINWPPSLPQKQPSALAGRGGRSSSRLPQQLPAAEDSRACLFGQAVTATAANGRS